LSNIIDIEELRKIDLRIGIVKHAERIEGSKKLIKLIVDLGNEERTIVAGLAEWYRPEELVGMKVVVVANLKPKKMFGVESQGMILAAEGKKRPAILTVLEDVEPGAKVW